MRGEHAVKIEHHEQAAQRTWTFFCLCGFSGACHSEAEAKRLVEGHLMSDKKIKPSGFGEELDKFWANVADDYKTPKCETVAKAAWVEAWNVGKRDGLKQAERGRVGT